MSTSTMTSFTTLQFWRIIVLSVWIDWSNISIRRSLSKATQINSRLSFLPAQLDKKVEKCSILLKDSERDEDLQWSVVHRRTERMLRTATLKNSNPHRNQSWKLAFLWLFLSNESVCSTNDVCSHDYSLLVEQSQGLNRSICLREQMLLRTMSTLRKNMNKHWTELWTSLLSLLFLFFFEARRTIWFVFPTNTLELSKERILSIEKRSSRISEQCFSLSLLVFDDHFVDFHWREEIETYLVSWTTTWKLANKQSERQTDIFNEQSIHSFVRSLIGQSSLLCGKCEFR